MAKLLAISTILLVSLLVFVAEASFRATINTVVEEENSQWGGRQHRCQQQIQQKRQQLRQCQQMISQSSRFDMDIIDQYYGQQQHGQCCQGLQSMNMQCRCEAVNQMVQEMMQHQGRGQQRERMEEIMEKARNLPAMCNLEPRQCQIECATRGTTINTVTEDEDRQWGGQRRCQQQFQQKRQQLRQCQQMISQGSRFETDIINEYGQQQQRQCCQGLQSMDRQCRCEAVNQMVQEMMQHHGQGQQSERMEEMMEKARHLPDMCNLEPRQCQIQSPYY